MDFYEFPEEVKAIHKTTILCHDWIMEREYLDEAISELLESALTWQTKENELLCNGTTKPVHLF